MPEPKANRPQRPGSEAIGCRWALNLAAVTTAMQQIPDPSLVEQTRESSAWAMPSGSGSRSARIHTSCAVVFRPDLDRAFAKWCLPVECDKPRRWATAFSDPAARTAATTTTSRSVARSTGRRGGRGVMRCGPARTVLEVRRDAS